MPPLKAADDLAWQHDQYAQGVHDGILDRPGSYSNQYYQRGWRNGKARQFYVEIYKCGCTSKPQPKRWLPGYCPTHGADRTSLESVERPHQKCSRTGKT